jgi:hypothetical protein
VAFRSKNANDAKTETAQFQKKYRNAVNNLTRLLDLCQKELAAHLKANVEKYYSQNPEKSAQQLADGMNEVMTKVWPGYHSFVQIHKSWHDGAW